MSKAKQTAEESKGTSSVAPAPSYHDTSIEPPSGSEPPPSDYSIFPRDTVIYRTEYISLILGPQYEANKPQPPPLFYVSVHMNKRWTNKSAVPQIKLHYGPDDTYPVIGAVRFRATTTSDITVWHDPKPVGTGAPKYDAKDNAALETKIEMTKSGVALSDVHAFYHKRLSPDGRLTREKFEWRHSGDPEVKALATENLPGENISQQDRGLKLVVASNGQMLAVFSGGKHQQVLNPKKVAGKLRFIGEPVLDPLVIVMTVLSIVERSRRVAVYNASASTFNDCLLS
jgi:hypothetical protein